MPIITTENLENESEITRKVNFFGKKEADACYIYVDEVRQLFHRRLIQDHLDPVEI